MFRQQNRFSFVFALCAIIAASAASAAEYSVSTAQELVDKLSEINPKNKSGNVIVLQKGNYDVSSYAMPWYRATTEKPSESHISASKVKLRGATGNARDVVIYGDGTKRILWVDEAELESLTISNGYTSASTTAKASGAGIYSDSSHPGTLTNVIITCCSANFTGSSGGAYGGAIRYGKLWNCQLIGNSTTSEGGGAHSCTIYNSIISGNTAASGGGVCASSVYAHSIISNNTATVRGGGSDGGVNKAVGSGVLRDSDILFNKVVGTSTSADIRGGAVYGCPMVSNCVIRGNAVGGANSNTRAGGATTLSNLYDCREVVDNFVENGFAAAMDRGVAYRCVFSNNCCSVNKCNVCDITAVNCTFYGGAVDYSGRFSHCQFLNLNDGGDYYVHMRPGVNVLAQGDYPSPTFVFKTGKNSTYTSGTIVATNCLFANNWTTASMLGKNDVDAISLVNCTIVDNHCRATFSDYTGSQSVGVGAITVINCAFPRNYDADVGHPARGDVRFEAGQHNVIFKNCLFGPIKWKDDNVTLLTPEENSVNNVADMKFDTTNAKHPYSIKRHSPAIGQGLYQDWMASATDLKGDPRAQEDGTVAIGCYECWLPASGLMLLLR